MQGSECSIRQHPSMAERADVVEALQQFFPNLIDAGYHTIYATCLLLNLVGVVVDFIHSFEDWIMLGYEIGTASRN